MEIKAAFTPRWHVARATARRMPLENEHKEIYETFHTKVAWHVAWATCHLHATPTSNMSVLFKRATWHAIQRWQISIELSLPNLVEYEALHFFFFYNKLRNPMKTFGCMAHVDWFSRDETHLCKYMCQHCLMSDWAGNSTLNEKLPFVIIGFFVFAVKCAQLGALCDCLFQTTNYLTLSL